MDRFGILTIYSVRFEAVWIAWLWLESVKIGERKAEKTGGVVMPPKKKHN